MGFAVKFTPTITAAAYAVGDQFGEITKIVNIPSSHDHGLHLSHLIVKNLGTTANDALLDFLFFDVDPTANLTGVADNAPIDISAAGLVKCVAAFSVAVADYIPLGASGTNAGIARLAVGDEGLISADVDGGANHELWLLTQIRTAMTPAVGDYSYVFNFQEKRR